MNIEKEQGILREYAMFHTNERRHLIFHGSCLDCITPERLGLGICLGCKLFDFDALASLSDRGIRPFYSRTKIEESDPVVDLS